MIKLMVFLSILSAICCQNQYEYDEYSPRHQFYSGPLTYEPQSQPRRSATYGPAPVHYVNIGTELAGDYKFGYDTGKGDDGQSFREETRLPDGTVQGSYGYTDESGKQRIVKYIAGKDGYKVIKDEKTGGSTAAQPVSTTSVPYNPPATRNLAQPENNFVESQPIKAAPESVQTNRQTSRRQPIRNNRRQVSRLTRQQARAVNSVPEPEMVQNSYSPEVQAYSPGSAPSYDPQRSTRNYVQEDSFRTHVPQTMSRSPSSEPTSGSYIPETRYRNYTPVSSRSRSAVSNESRLASSTPENRSRSSEPQSRSRSNVVKTRSRNTVPRRRYVPRPAPDYDYYDDLTERKVAPIDTTLLSYNIGTSQSDQLSYFHSRY